MVMKKYRFILISVLLIPLIYLTSCIYITPSTTEDGFIHLYVSIENNEVVIDKDVSFSKGEYLIDVLNRHLDVVLGSGSSDGMIMSINGCLAPDDYSYYYKLVINCEYASYGAEKLSLNDGDSVMITYSSLDDWSTGC